MSEPTKKSDQIEIGALWKKDGREQKFLAGNIDLKPLGIDKVIPVVIFTNKFKQKDTHPDLRVYLSKPKNDTAPAAAPAAKAASTPAPAPTPEPEQPESDEII